MKKEPTVKKVLFTEREVAAMGFLDAATLRNQRSKKTGIPFIKIGRSVRYRKDDLERYLDRSI